MNHRQALWGLHISAVAFGLTGVFGKLALASAAVVVFGRACFAVLSLLVVAGRASDRRLPSPRQLAWLGLAGLAHQLPGASTSRPRDTDRRRTGPSFD